ncbi:DUF6396 domain-containing protein [Enterobacteriaceae bacterium ESL0689]|nr:DUF6396 domain-containing protein [Enterobacteriaceae bacterium ESL0689]
MNRLTLLLCLLLVTCDGASTPFVISDKKAAQMKPLNDINVRLTFTCKHQTIPEPSADSDVLFKYARWLQKNNLLKQDKKVDTEVERLYRIAAENGHYKAMVNLQNGALRGHFSLTSEERLRFSQRMIDAKVAAGYYFIAIYLQQGSAGLKQDPEMALRYFRKAADEGNPQAQDYVGEKLSPAKMAPQVAMQMFRCAAEQGEGQAATSLGIMQSIDKKYQEAVKAFQLGVAAGDTTSAIALYHGFDDPEPTDRLYYLALQKDPERARRYKVISSILSDYSYVHPKVPEINEIVPLPPAPLPAWDGKLKWIEEYDANIEPQKPSDRLIVDLANAKQLNPQTGRPLPSSPDFASNSAPRILCRTGEPCPKSGYWKIAWIPNVGVSKEETRYFREGQIMPTDRVVKVIHRPWPFKAKWLQEDQHVDWKFMGEA